MPLPTIRTACPRTVMATLALLGLMPWRSFGASPPPLDAFFSGIRMDSPALSPDAHYLAAIVTASGRSFVAVRDLTQNSELRPVAVTRADDRFSPDWCAWAKPTRLLCGFVGIDSIFGDYTLVSRLMAVNADGSDVRILGNTSVASNTVRAQIQDEVLDLWPEDPRQVLIQLSEGRPPSGFPDVYALDIYSGSRRLVVHGREPIQTFKTDGRGQVRLGYGARDTKVSFFARLDGERPWRELTRVESSGIADAFLPVAVVPGTNSAYAMRNYQGRRALWRIDLTDATEPALVFAHPAADLGRALFTSDNRLLGVSFQTDRPGCYYTDRDAARIYDAVRRALPGRTIRIIDMTPEGKVFLVEADSDVAAPLFYLMDTRSSPARLEGVGAGAPGLADYALAPAQPIGFAARDGVQIPGYLTLPVQRPASGPPPLVVLPHGGPYSRDSWGYDPWVQFLASHGYAVLQVEFRGSTGYGSEWLQAGFRDWAGKPYDDVIDGTRWALAQGHGDPRRTCIVGASYGGYIALLAATRGDGLYRCAVSIAGVSDLVELRNRAEIYLNSELAKAQMPDPKKLKADSPRNHAAGVSIPILLLHGANDYTVEVAQTEAMDTALKRAGKPHETVIIKDTDHYFREDAARRTLFTNLGRFLDEQLDGRAP